MKSLVIIIFLTFLFIVPCYGTNYHVRPSTDCSYDGDGTTWACASAAGQPGARKGFPTTLVRDNTYYVAAGTYGQTTLSTAVDGSKYIYIKKATDDNHGIETGWESSFGSGQAVFSWTGGTTVGNVLTVKTSYFDIDGQTGGYPNWTSGHGFKVTTDNPKATLFCITHNGTGTAVAGYIHLHHTELAHTGRETNSLATGTYGPLVMSSDAPTGGSHSAGNHEFSYNYIHDSPAMLAWGYRPGSFIFEYNYLDTSAALEPGSTNQGSGITTYGGQSQIYRYNIFKDMKGSCGICLYSWHGDLTVSDIKIYGNTFFYSPAFQAESINFVQNGWIATDGGTDDATNIKVYNNTFSNLKGYKMFWIAYTGGTGNEVKNNLLYQCQGVTLEYGELNGFSHGYNWFYGNVAYNNLSKNLDSNWAGGESSTGEIGTSDPFRDITGYDFRLAYNTECGDDTIGTLYATDLLGNTRLPGNWSKGCYQSGPPDSPKNLKIIIKQ